MDLAFHAYLDRIHRWSAGRGFLQFGPGLRSCWLVQHGSGCPCDDCDLERLHLDAEDAHACNGRRPLRRFLPIE